ncbi:MAG: single-stranded DNA-binding protein [Candidatus Dormibacteria bacterium]
MSQNQVNLAGRCASSFELTEHNRKDGSAPALRTSFLFAVPGMRVDGPPDWVRVTAWGNVAEALAGQVTKGDFLEIRGRLRGRWSGDGPDGRGGKLYTEVVVQTVVFINGTMVTEQRPPKAAPATPALAATSLYDTVAPVEVGGDVGKGKK